MPSEWLNYAALSIAAASLATSFLRTARVQGADRQRISALEGSRPTSLPAKASSP